MRTFIGRENYFDKSMCYTTFYDDRVIPTPHTSGYWEHKFEFNNDYFILLAVI